MWHILEKRNAHKASVGLPVGERQLGRTSPRRRNSIKINPKEIRWGDVNWLDLAEDRDKCWAIVNTAINFRVS
jgi:hypothetical protein